MKLWNESGIDADDGVDEMLEEGSFLPTYTLPLCLKGMAQAILRRMKHSSSHSPTQSIGCANLLTMPEAAYKHASLHLLHISEDVGIISRTLASMKVSSMVSTFPVKSCSQSISTSELGRLIRESRSRYL